MSSAEQPPSYVVIGQRRTNIHYYMSARFSPLQKLQRPRLSTSSPPRCASHLRLILTHCSGWTQSWQSKAMIFSLFSKSSSTADYPSSRHGNKVIPACSRNLVDAALSFFRLFSDRWHVDLEVIQLERKIRLLTLASLGFQKVGQNVPYSKIAETLQVDVSEVEKWVIDGMISCSLPFHCCPSKVIF